MAKRIDTMKIKISLVVLGAVILLIVAAYPILGNKTTQQTVKEVVPAFAPAEYAYPEYFTDQELSGGYSWRLNENNVMTISKGDENYTVTADGQVYRDTGNGMELVTDQNIINDVLKAAQEAQNSSDTARDYFDTNLEDKITLTDDEINDLTGGVIDPDAFRELQQKGLSIDEILDLLKKGFTPDVILNAPDQDYAALLDYLERQKEIDDQLAASLKGSGITLDDFKKMLQEIGMTPEEYLKGLESIQSSQTQSQTTTAAPISISKSEVAAMTVDLGGNQSTVEQKEQQYQAYAANPVDTASLASAIASASKTTTATDYENINNQAGKQEFMSSYSGNSGISQLTTNDIAAGTIISMTLKTGLNSDLPGMIVAEVNQNVFDSLTGRVLLIPKGTRLIASYDSSVSWGQKRALVAWTQLIRPDGLVLQLPGFSGVDAAGYTGYNDKVNNHTWDLIKSAFLASVLDLGANEVKTQANDADAETIGRLLGSFTDSVESAGQEYLKKQMNLQPTLTVRPGRTIKLLVNQTITLTPYKR